MQLVASFTELEQAPIDRLPGVLVDAIRLAHREISIQESARDEAVERA